jgi:catechol 2,3-dioxygenase-like lactoylglutathione lyase family enzyme
MNVQGFSHVTLRVRDLQRSLDFYRDKLGMKVVHIGRKDAYLEWGEAWVCIMEKRDDPPQTLKTLGVDHIAFFIPPSYFDEAVQRLKEHGITIVRGPLKRGTGWSVNFLDPDGTELELHTSTLQERMTVWT